MKESIAISKVADVKKDFSPAKSDNSIHRVRNKPEGQLGSLRSVIDNIRHDGGTPSVESIATELSNMPATAQPSSVLLALQRTHGNQYVQRVVAGIQAKLKIGQPNDIYEQEADRVAAEVMRRFNADQRQSVQLGQSFEDAKEKLQMKPIAQHACATPVHLPNDAPKRKTDRAADAIVTAARTSESSKVTDVSLKTGAYAVDSLLRDNSRFPPNVRDVMNQAESALGIDLSHVILDTSVGAERVARILNARAFTIGNHIAFARGEFRPDTANGRRLIAHELTHVAQQNRRWKRRNIASTLTLSDAPPHAIQRTAVAFYTSGDDSPASPPASERE